MLYPSFWLPWNSNVILAALPIFYIGYSLKNSKIKINIIILLLLSVVILIGSYFFNENTYDMKYSIYGVPFITLISSLIIIISIKSLSKILSRVKVVNTILTQLGKASMIIMYLHIPLLLLFDPFIHKHRTLLFISSTLISYLLYFLISKNVISRALFLGSKEDFNSIFLNKK